MSWAGVPRASAAGHGLGGTPTHWPWGWVVRSWSGQLLSPPWGPWAGPRAGCCPPRGTEPAAAPGRGDARAIPRTPRQLRSQRELGCCRRPSRGAGARLLGSRPRPSLPRELAQPGEAGELGRGLQQGPRAGAAGAWAPRSPPHPGAAGLSPPCGAGVSVGARDGSSEWPWRPPHWGRVTGRTGVTSPRCQGGPQTKGFAHSPGEAPPRAGHVRGGTAGRAAPAAGLSPAAASGPAGGTEPARGRAAVAGCTKPAPLGQGSAEGRGSGGQHPGGH